MKTQLSPQAPALPELALQIADQFGQTLVQGDFAAAHALLTPEVQQQFSPDQLQQAVAEMIAYANAPLRQAMAIPEFLLSEWPTQQPGDVAWVYVSLEGEAFAEAVSVVLSQTEAGLRICERTWGRP